MMNVKFKKIYELINCEGTILSLVEDLNNEDQLYIQGLCLKRNIKIYTKVSDSSLALYLKGRITLRELFSLNGNENYLLEKRKKIQPVFISNEQSSEIMKTLECGNSFYPEVSQNMRSSKSVDEILIHITEEWMRGVGARSSEILDEKEYLQQLT